MALSTPAPDEGLHTALIKHRLPLWLTHSASADIRRLRGGVQPGPAPAWLSDAPAELRAALSASQLRSHASNQVLAKTLKPLKGPAAFAQPLLEAALQQRFGQAPDVHQNALFYLRYRQATVQHTLLQAALLNFEGNETFSEVALGETSALAPVGALKTDYGTFTRGGWPARYRYTEKLPIAPQDFATMCRQLDLGKQYQNHLKQVFDAPDTALPVRAQMIQAQKDLLAVRLHTARIKHEVSASFYAVLLKLLAGAERLTLDGRPLGYTQLSVLGCPLGEVVLIGPPAGRLVAWIAGAPLYPLKEYASMQAFEKDLAINLRSRTYQRLLASRVPQGDAPAFFKRLQEKLFTYRWNAAKGVQEQVYDEQINLNLRESRITGELFGALYEKHVQRLKEGALKLAVPTAEADRKAAQERHQYWLGLGMNLLNVAAFFVPGLGELMLVVTAIQVGMEVYHGIESWKQGDLDAAWAHLESVALNVAFMATLAGTGVLLRRPPVIQVSKWVDGLVPVKLPSGEARLWKPDLEPYRSDVVLDPALQPNAQGQYEVDGKIYVRIGAGVYEKGFDTQLKKWRIKHPRDPEAYQPELHGNQAGAWRSIHERPRDWSRLTLLRRLGHATRSFADDTLLRIGDISGVSDEALCKIHLDGSPLPAPLADTLRRFRVDQPTTFAEAPLRDSEWLQRRFPGLPREAMAEVLAQASEPERVQIRSSGRVPARLDNLARAQAQQVRLSRAIAGLHRDSLASADSDRLALHSLEQLPGWPGNIRLEVRADAFDGVLLDSIGPEAAPVRRYLVKHDGTFLACNERGEPLANAVPDAHNAYQSILQALPEAARRDMGFARVGQEAELQRALADYAVSHRTRMSAFLKQRVARSRPQWRLSNTRAGFTLSGRGDAFAVDASLVTRVQDLYPELSSEQASRFVRARLRGGDTTQQVFNLLANRRREFDTLRATLEEWAQATGEPLHLPSARQQVAEALTQCWRQNLYRGIPPHARFNLGVEHRLPALAADFSHVQALRLEGPALLGDDGAALFQLFPRVQHLEVSVMQADLGAVGERLRDLPGITQLSINGPELNLATGLEPVLTGMPQLERLALRGALESLDVSGLPDLRTLEVSGSLAAFPEGLVMLERLEAARLQDTRICTVPEAVFAGHERLWRGLELNWSTFEPEAAMRVFDYLHDNPAHLVDEAQWVQAYCAGALRSMKGALARDVPSQLSGRERVLQVNELRNEHRQLLAELEAWKTRGLEVGRQQQEGFYRERAADNVLASWREGLDRRVAGDTAPGEAYTDSLDLSGGGLASLPQLPMQGFAHVRFLSLNGIRVSVEALDGLLDQFPMLYRLDLARNSLALLPSRLSELRLLEHLDLSYNELTLTHAMQQQLNELGNLQELSLAYNRVGRLDVRALKQLRGLNLSHSGIATWPEGVLDLPALRRLDLSHSAITEIPAQALTEHQTLMQGTQLRGCRLGPQALADLQRFEPPLPPSVNAELQRLAQHLEPQALAELQRRMLQHMGGDAPLGIPRDLLARGLTGGDPEYFPLEVADDPGLLLDVPEGLPGGEQQQMLTRQLNTWIDIRAYREGSGWVSAVDRRRAADRILQSWRNHLHAQPEGDATTLDLSALCLGDLPALGHRFEHVTTLNLSAVRLTEQGSNGFVRAFPQLRRLILSRNGLSRLPQAVHELPALEALDLGGNAFNDLDITALPRLETLDLRDNGLTDWPAGCLAAPRLRNLNLSNNRIESIPDDAWYPEHLGLMAGTDLSDNLLLAPDLRRLHDYFLDTGHGLGFSEAEIDELLDGYEEASEDEGEAHPELQSPQAQKNQWCSEVLADSKKQALWDELSAAEGSADFFFILSQLRYAEDFSRDRIELTRRVWDVLETAHQRPEVREMLFAKAAQATQTVTCGDGWSLLFSDLEIGVYEFKALNAVAPGEEGLSLFKLARGMIRLEEVEASAATAISQRPRVDPAEVRLAYRIGLAKRLELPRQPSSMIYQDLANVPQADIDSAYSRIIAGESAPAFADKLVARSYWVDYLKRKYPAEFAEQARQHNARVDALDARHADLNPQYLADSVVLDRQRTQEATALALQLTARERTAFGV